MSPPVKLCVFCTTVKHASREIVADNCGFHLPVLQSMGGCNLTMLHTKQRDWAGNTRFYERRKRIARRTERDNFTRMIMPTLYTFGVLGWLVFLFTLLLASLNDTEISGYTVIAAGPTLLVGLMESYRFVRGHHSKALDEP